MAYVNEQRYYTKEAADSWYDLYIKDGLSVRKEYHPATSKWVLHVEFDK